jgi:hypothetical protein
VQPVDVARTRPGAANVEGVVMLDHSVRQREAEGDLSPPSPRCRTWSIHMLERMTLAWPAAPDLAYARLEHSIDVGG